MQYDQKRKVFQPTATPSRKDHSALILPMASTALAAILHQRLELRRQIMTWHHNLLVQLTVASHNHLLVQSTVARDHRLLVPSTAACHHHLLVQPHLRLSNQIPNHFGLHVIVARCNMSTFECTRVGIFSVPIARCHF
ncbi:Uncharacterized protein M6B38_215675 [Iris pallida]|uniref:Uncharacterized protein n=1 Tax=Iris pallida TaxID=29817 RepID=A0AAX6E0X1_IRIPA|nr:Uncharacterized protein M6B38_215675 [Iris pallida]